MTGMFLDFEELDTRSVKFRKICWTKRTKNSKLRHQKKNIEVTALCSPPPFIPPPLFPHHFTPSPATSFALWHSVLSSAISQSLVYPIRVSARTRGSLCTPSFVCVISESHFRATRSKTRPRWVRFRSFPMNSTSIIRITVVSVVEPRWPPRLDQSSL